MLAKTDETLLNLDQFKGVLAFDEDKSQCTVQAGTRLEDLGEYLAPIHQALLNQGDIDQQSLAELQGALWIATPMLKVLHYSQLPDLELLLVPKSCEIDRADYVFLRPTQSEAVIPQFAPLSAYAQCKF